ncbi:MAG: hypothetical protein QOJ80_1007, partial [Mycobacterium sp.]|nr:hypothetical protein [Mycobacterium sp.]
MNVRRFGFARPLCSSRPPNPTYDAAVSIPGDLE